MASSFQAHCGFERLKTSRNMPSTMVPEKMNPTFDVGQNQRGCRPEKVLAA